MHDHLMGPLLGNIFIIIVAGAITVACFLVMLWLLIRPGETDPGHAKQAILRDDR